MLAARVNALVWLKLITPVPEPNVMADVLRVPAESLPPSAPMFSVPPEPASEAMNTLVAATVPPLAMVRLLPPPIYPRNKAWELVHCDPVPVTSTELLEDVA